MLFLGLDFGAIFLEAFISAIFGGHFSGGRVCTLMGGFLGEGFSEGPFFEVV